MKELWIAAALGGLFFGYKKYVSKPTPAVNPFGVSGCRLSIRDAQTVVDQVAKPAYMQMRAQIMSVSPKEFDSYRSIFYTVWKALSQSIIDRYTPVFNERSCSEKDYIRASQEFSGLIACMMLRDLRDTRHINEESADIEALCAKDPREVYALIESMYSV